MKILNYAHPLTAAQQAQASALLGAAVEIQDIATQIDRTLPLADEARRLAEAANLSASDWQTTPLLLNPPALAPVALALIAELHGRCGYFVPILHLRPVAGALPPQYEIAEIVNLTTIREQARTRR